MALNPNDRDFNMPDADLIVFGNSLASTMTRDLSDLGAFGVTSLAVTNLQSLCLAFEVFPADDYMLGLMMIATENKDAKSAALRETVRQMAGRVAAKWGTNSGQYKELKLTGMGDFSDNDLLVAADMVHLTMNDYLTDLAVYGLTSAMLTAMQTQIDDLRTALKSQLDAIKARDLKTKDRIAKANELYNYISRCCEFGKLEYEQTDEAKYNDYLIYPGGSSGLPPKMQGFIFYPEMNTFRWTEQTGITSYNVQFSANDIDWFDQYNNAFPEYFYTMQEGNWHYRVRAFNAVGPGAWSDTLDVVCTLSTPGLTNPTYDAGTGNVLVPWGEGSTHSPTYEVWRSIVAAGLPAGTFTKVADTPNTYWNHTGTTPNTREYYYIKAKAGAETSGRSEVKWVDVV